MKKQKGFQSSVAGSSETNVRLAQLEQRLMRCKRSFEMYFSGLEKLPPLKKFDALKIDFRRLSEHRYSTAVLRFKVQNMMARWQSMRKLWERQMLQKERGSYKPGVGAAPGRAVGRRKKN